MCRLLNLLVSPHLQLGHVTSVICPSTLQIATLHHCWLFAQECKALNARLIAYLKGEDVIHKLVSFVIEPAKSWASERQQQRFPFIACEVIKLESGMSPQSVYFPDCCYLILENCHKALCETSVSASVAVISVSVNLTCGIVGLHFACCFDDRGLHPLMHAPLCCRCYAVRSTAFLTR